MSSLPGNRTLQTVLAAVSQFPRLYLQLFLNGFCRYIPLPLVALLLVGFASGLIGDGMGIQFLFFHYEPWKGFAAGFFFSLVFACILLVGYLLWKRDSARDFVDDGGTSRDSGSLIEFAQYSAVVGTGFVLSAAVLTVTFAFVSFAARSHLLSSASPDSTSGDAITFANPATFWATAQLDDAGESQFITENVTLSYWPFAVGLLCGFLAALAFLKLGASERLVRGLPRSGEKAGAARSETARRYRSALLCVCLVLGGSMVLLLGRGQMNESASASIRLTVAGTALAIVAGSWAALRWGRASGFFAFLVVHLLAAHLTLTWLAFQTSGQSATILGRRVEYGGWWLSGILSLALGALFLVGARRGYRERAHVLFGSAASHLKGPQGARLHRAAATLTGCTFLLFFVSATGLLKIEMLVNPAVTSLFLFFLAVLAYGTFAYVVPRGMKVSVAFAAGIFLLVGGVQRYKYPIRYPDHAATSQAIDSSEPFMDYSAPLDLEKQLAYEREQQQGGINDLARLATREGGRDAQGRIVYPPARLEELRARYARNDPRQRLIPLKLFIPDSKSLFDFIPEFPEPPPGQTETVLLPPSKFGFAGRPPQEWEAGKAERAPLVIVAVSGGAMRAAAWTHAILAELELLFAERGIDFPAHVRMIAGASGGMFGAGHYVVALPPPSVRGTPAARKAKLDADYQSLVQDSLTPLMNQMVFGDIPNLFSPWPHRYDRGRALEDAWAANGLHELTSTTFHDLREREKAGWCPSLVISPMIVEDGRRLLFSNLDLRYVVSNDGRLIRSRDPYTVDGWLANYSREGFEFFRMFPGERNRLRVSTAVRLSASFPILSPAPALPTQPRRRVVDAGYYDNFGVSLASAWLFSSAHADWIKHHASKVLLIQVRAFESERSRTLGRVEHGGNRRVFESIDSSLTGRAVEDLVTPMVGVNKARESANSFRNDEQLELLTRSVRNDIGIEFSVLNMELKVREDLLPLNWYMTRQMTDGIRGEAKNLLYELPPNAVDDRRLKDYLLNWWNAPERAKK
ncbi:MAG: patatin-like phospholipase family protein [Gemmataceae bacterium]